MPKTAYKIRPAGSLAEACEHLLGLFGGAKRAALLPGCRVSAQQLFKYTDDDGENRSINIPADVAAYFEAQARHPLVSAWMAQQSGHMVVPLPTPDGEIDLVKMLAELATESGQAFADAGAALADGKVTEAEARQIITDLYDVARVCMGAIAALEHRGRGDDD